MGMDLEKANSQAESLEQIGQGIEQLSGVVQGNAASSEENTAISINPVSYTHLCEQIWISENNSLFVILIYVNISVTPQF